MHHPSLRFVHRVRVVTMTDVPPDRTLLELLREDD
jgi:xanthine dehydrogenase iron-sulfur cluster and FAD-binding subunit A